MITENNKYLDYAGLEHLRKNYIQNIYVINQSLPAESFENDNLKIDQSTDYTITNCGKDGTTKTLYSFSEAKIGDILFYPENQTAYIVTTLGVNQDYHVAKPIAGGGLDSIQYGQLNGDSETDYTVVDITDPNVNYYDVIVFNLTNGDKICLNPAKLQTSLNEQFEDLKNAAITTEETELVEDNIVIGTGGRTVKSSSYTVNDIVSIAQGKTASYVISIDSSATNEYFNSNQDDIVLGYEYSGETPTVNVVPHLNLSDNKDVPISDLKIGDIVLVKEPDLPDRWVSAITKTPVVNNSRTRAEVTFSILETEKIDLNPYLTKPTDTTAPETGPIILTANYTSTDDNNIFTTYSGLSWSNEGDSIQKESETNSAPGTTLPTASAIATKLDSYLTTQDAKDLYVPTKTVVEGTDKSGVYEKSIEIQSVNEKPLFGPVFEICYGHTEFGIMSNTAKIDITDDSNKAYLGTTWHTNHTINFESYGAETLTGSASINRIKIGPKTFTRQHEITGTEYEILDTSMSITTSTIDKLFNSSIS